MEVSCGTTVSSLGAEPIRVRSDYEGGADDASCLTPLPDAIGRRRIQIGNAAAIS